MSIHFNTLAPKVLPAVPGCPFSLVMAGLRDAAAEFCTRTLVWQEDLAAISLTAENAFHTLTPPPGARIVMVLRVELDGRPLRAANEDLLDEEHPGWRALSPGTPVCYVLPKPRELRLVPAPAEAATNALTVRAAMAPAKDAVQTEDFLLEDYGQAVIHGALAELYGFVGLSWANAERAAHHARQFRAAIADARAKVHKSNLPNSLSARPRSFANV